MKINGYVSIKIKLYLKIQVANGIYLEAIVCQFLWQIVSKYGQCQWPHFLYVHTVSNTKMWQVILLSFVLSWFY